MEQGKETTQVYGSWRKEKKQHNYIDWSKERNNKCGLEQGKETTHMEWSKKKNMYGMEQGKKTTYME